MLGIEAKNKNILVVVRWPLGGIRTYMKYIFSYFPQGYKLTLIAASTQENETLKNDAQKYGARLIVSRKEDIKGLVYEVLVELRKNHYDVILSQGFISALAVYFSNLFFKIPHILTIHGVLEPRFLEGKFKKIKYLILNKVLKDLTVLYAVSNDILEHLYNQFPSLNNLNNKAVVIPNGIVMNEFEITKELPIQVRKRLGIPETTFVFGFFGRFMPQKGFDLLIDAIDILKQKEYIKPFIVLAVGSGDYLPYYKKTIQDRGLEKYFKFLPFQPQIKSVYLEVNAIVMPSRWEAAPLQPMEALSLGIPFIASDCIGLRETVRDTPVTVFESESLTSLVESLQLAVADTRLKEFKEFVPVARQRFDVSKSSHHLVQIIEDVALRSFCE